jgi:hypothetical protein
MYGMKKNLLTVTVFLLMLAPGQTIAQSGDWYKQLTGTIGKYPISMHLHKRGATLNGYYFYNSREQPIFLAGSDTSGGKGGIKLFGALEETLSFSLKNGKGTGKWRKDEKDNTGLLLSLTEKPTNPDFVMIYVKDSMKLRPHLSAEASFEAMSIWPRGTSSSSNFLKVVINNEFGNANSSQDVGKTLLASKKEFFAGYMEENRETSDSDIVEYSSSYSMEESHSLGVLFKTSRLLTLAHAVYTYMGGAHGNYGTSFINIDLLTNKVLNLKDVLNPAGIGKLNPLLEKYFRKDLGLKPSESLMEGGLFEDKIEYNENFYLTSKGIGFGFTPYEIAPYAAGEINIFIPFSELSAYLQPGFRKLIQ